MQRTWKRAVVVTGFILTLGAAVSWGQVPPTNDTSDDSQNTGGGTGALGNVTPGVPSPFSGTDNTAYGKSALGLTSSGSRNAAFGSTAFAQNTTGSFNTAVGADALTSNTTAGSNTAVGNVALFSTTTGGNNTAVGSGALFSTTTGGNNTAVGGSALNSNTTGERNIAVGGDALFANTTGMGNIAFGFDALFSNTTGNDNIAVGGNAGVRLTSGSQNIYLGHPGPAGDHSESQTMRLGRRQTRTFIAGIANSPLTGSPVVITSTGRLGIVVSSARYKRNIHSMGKSSQGLFQLRPVTFRYKQDAQGQKQYGLIAEEVAQVYPELVTKGAEGKVESVQYHELIPLLLNEVQHQQQAIVELKAQNERLQAALVQQTAALAARLEQLEHAPHSAAVAAR